MARTFKKHSRRHHGPRSRRHHGTRSRRGKRMIKKGFKIVKSTSRKGFKRGFSTVKSTSRKYMPAVKSGLEGVGSKVSKTATKSIPILQKTTRDLFGLIGYKKKGKH